MWAEVFGMEVCKCVGHVSGRHVWAFGHALGMVDWRGVGE